MNGPGFGREEKRKKKVCKGKGGGSPPERKGFLSGKKERNVRLEKNKKKKNGTLVKNLKAAEGGGGVDSPMRGSSKSFNDIRKKSPF